MRKYALSPEHIGRQLNHGLKAFQKTSYFIVFCPMLLTNKFILCFARGLSVVFARVLHFFIFGGRKADLVCNRLKIQLRCGIMIL